MMHVSSLDMSTNNTCELPHGTLDLLILTTLDTIGPLHGYSIARRIEQVAGNNIRLSQGAVYPALMRLEQQRFISTRWGLSETSRKVKFYALTKAGAKQLDLEKTQWQQATALVARFLDLKA